MNDVAPGQDLKTQAQQLIELNEKRTPGEWFAVDRLIYALCAAGEVNRFSAHVDGGWIRKRRAMLTHEERTPKRELDGNVSFITHTANHAPAIAQAYLDKCEEIERLRSALGNIEDHYVARSEIYTNDADLAANLYDHARQALGANNDQA